MMKPGITDIPKSDQDIVIVTGLPRSGTSMMMQMLHSGGYPVLTDMSRQADEDNPRGYFEFEAVKRLEQDSVWLAEAHSHAVKMIYILVYQLPTHLKYKVIYMHRDLHEVVTSQQVMLKRLNQNGALRPAPSPVTSSDDMIHIYERQLKRFNEWLSIQSHFSVLHIDYATTIKDPAHTASLVNQFLGGKLNEEQMTHSVHPDLYRQKLQVHCE